MPPEVVQRDSLVTTNTVEKLKDTTIIIPADSSSIFALLETDSTNQIRIREIVSYKIGKDMTPPTLSIKNNVLT
ncbi:MAG: hypothetical protein LLF94_09480, partial [Chlamydiales bacterium]|nr:hypothetical protein [Chlamydiales bacterium]